MYVCVYFVCHHCVQQKQPNELKFGTLTVSIVRFLQPLEALAAMRIVGVASENVKCGHENSPKVQIRNRLAGNSKKSVSEGIANT